MTANSSSNFKKEVCDVSYDGLQILRAEELLEILESGTTWQFFNSTNNHDPITTWGRQIHEHFIIFLRKTYILLRGRRLCLSCSCPVERRVAWRVQLTASKEAVDLEWCLYDLTVDGSGKWYTSSLWSRRSSCWCSQQEAIGSPSVASPNWNLLSPRMAPTQTGINCDCNGVPMFGLLPGNIEIKILQDPKWSLLFSLPLLTGMSWNFRIFLFERRRLLRTAWKWINFTYGGLLLSLQNCVPEATKVGPWQLHRFVLFGNSPNSHSASPSPR